MTRPRFYNTEAIVLKQMPLGEADRLLTLYTPEYGKLRAVTRGARRVRSKLGGHVELLTRCLLSLNQGSTFYVVGQAQTLESHRHLRENLELVSTGLYLAELVDLFTVEENPNPALYRLLQQALAWLGTQGERELLARFFELHILHLSGYLPELHRCVECQRPLQEGEHRFYPAGGGTLCLVCRPTQGAIMPLPASALKVLRFLRVEEYERVARLRLGPRLEEELEQLLGSYIRHILERDVHAAAFLDHLRRQASRARGAGAPV